MPDPQTFDTAANVGKIAAAFGALAATAFGVVRGLARWSKSLGISGELAETAAKYLQNEIESLRKRLAETEDALHRAELESIAWTQRYIALESEVHLLRKEIEALRGAWNPDDTLPPGLR